MIDDFDTLFYQKTDHLYKNKQINWRNTLMDLVDICRIIYTNAKENTLTLEAHGTSSTIDQIQGHKINLYKLKKTEIGPLTCLIIMQ